jgi:hypothetical protein
VRIDYYKRLSSLITSYKIRVVTYYFHNIEILTKYTNLNTITIIDEELYNLSAIGVYIAIDFDTEACQLIVAI